MACSDESIFLGVDIGTQGVRCMLWQKGAVVASSARSLTTVCSRGGWAEQDAEQIWEIFLAAVGEVLQHRGNAPTQVCALGIDATASIFLVDQTGRPLTPVMLWMDVRAAGEAEEVGQRIGRPESAELPWAKALWMAHHQPDIFREAAYIVEIADWVIWRLTGTLMRSKNSAVLKWHAKIDGSWPGWAEEYPFILEKLSGSIIGVGEAVATVQDPVWERLGVPKLKVTVAGPIIDAYAAAIGSWAVNEGDMALILGTSTCELIHGRGLRPIAGLWGPFTDVYGLGIDVLEAGHPSTGSVVRWIEQNFGCGQNLATWEEEAIHVEPGCQGLKVHAAFQGVRSPWPDGSARGQIHGLTLAHGPSHMLRATYEGTAYDIRRVIEVLTEPVERIVASGGGLKSRLWPQIIADVAGVPLILADNQAVTRGAAWLGARALNWPWPHSSEKRPTLLPSIQRERYRGLYQAYQAEFPLQKTYLN